MNHYTTLAKAEEKSSLIAKTYLLLTIGFILMGAGIITGLPFVPKLLSLGKWGYLIISLAVTIGTMLLSILNQKNVFGYLFFLLFTFSIGFFDAPAVAIILASPTLLIIAKKAFILTALITGGMTLYAFISKKDFSGLSGFLTTGLIIVFVMAIVSLFWHNNMFEFVLSGIGAVLFSLFILRIFIYICSISK